MMKKLLVVAALASASLLATIDVSEAYVCARGPYRAGCAGPAGSVVRGPYGGTTYRGRYGGAAYVGPYGGAVVRRPYYAPYYRRW
ncbi:hypothetical protein ACNHKD_13800 [Methylocystis sp. JAN1]|uniref:hypothetical protein n=1 Tax=Methylocystis sp. JAN1 TaxID=3397211 RepID=UPI003FA20ED8